MSKRINKQQVTPPCRMFRYIVPNFTRPTLILKQLVAYDVMTSTFAYGTPTIYHLLLYANEYDE